MGVFEFKRPQFLAVFITIGPDRAKQDVNKQELSGDLAQIQSGPNNVHYESS